MSMQPGQELAHPNPTMALWQPGLAVTMCMSPCRWLHPPPSVPPFLLTQNLRLFFSAQCDVTKSALLGLNDQSHTRTAETRPFYLLLFFGPGNKANSPHDVQHFLVAVPFGCGKFKNTTSYILPGAYVICYSLRLTPGWFSIFLVVMIVKPEQVEIHTCTRHVLKCDSTQMGMLVWHSFCSYRVA